MRWEIERYVRVYRRDKARWALVPWRTKAFFWELLRKADLDGRIEIDDLRPAQAVVALFGGEPEDEPEIERHLKVLFADGCVWDVPASGRQPRHLLIRNYRDAQDVPMTGAERTKKWREEREKKQADTPPRDGGDAVTRQRHGRHGDESDARDAHPSRSEPIRTSRSDPKRTSAEASPATGSLGGDPLADFRQGLADALAIASSNPLRIANGERAQRMRGHVAALGVEAAVAVCAEAVREAGRVPGTGDWFEKILERAVEEEEQHPQRAPGENPKPGDPDFNDPAAWRDHGEYLARTDGRTWEQVTGMKRPTYVPPKTPEEEAEERARAEAERNRA